jgi:hypothetical protein
MPKRRTKEQKKEGDVSNIICPFCSKPWNEGMVELWEEASGYCSTCYSSEAKVKITCDGCDKLIYEK